MTIIKFSPDREFADLGPGAPPPAPLDGPMSEISSKSFAAERAPGNRAGVWKCSPGRWRRQVKQAEFCYFLSGECTFEPDSGPAMDIKGGDAVYFPENTTGVWTIHTESRKIFLVFNES